MKIRFLSMLLLTACVVEGDDPPPPCSGKCDGASAPRTLTVGADRRPVDGALVEIHLEPVDHGRWNVIREATYFDRRAGREVHDSETLVDAGDCTLGLDRIACGETLDDVVELTFTGTGYDAEFVTPTDTRDLGTNLALRHVQWSAVRADGALVELLVDGSRDGFSATLRTTSPATDGVPEARSLFAGATCAVDVESAALACTDDNRPVDGPLVELRVAPEAYPSYDYGATIRTAGRRLDGYEYDRTEQVDALDLR